MKGILRKIPSALWRLQAIREFRQALRNFAQCFSHFAAASRVELSVRPVFQIFELTIGSSAGFFKRHNSVPTEIILAMPVG